MHSMDGPAQGLESALRPSGGRRLHVWPVAVCAAMCGASALADGDGGGSATVTAASSLSPPAFEIASSTATGSANLGNSNTTRLEINTWSRPAAQPALGLAVGVDTPPANWTGNRAQSSIDVGVRWRSAPVNQRRIDVVAFRRISQPNQPQDAYTLIQNADQPIYSARVEMQFKSAKFGGLTPEFGAIGMQLDGGGKVVLRGKRGGPMVYYRSSF